MTDDDAAGKAMEALNGTNLGGRNLTVNEARPKADRPRREGGGGGVAAVVAAEAVAVVVAAVVARRRRWWWWRLGPLLVR